MDTLVLSVCSSLRGTIAQEVPLHIQLEFVYLRLFRTNNKRIFVRIFQSFERTRYFRV